MHSGRSASACDAERGDEDKKNEATISDYYISQSPTSDPGQYRYLVDDLPTDLAGIAKVTQGLVYHYFADQHHYGWQPPQERIPEINTRTMERTLAALLEKDGRPLTEARAYQNRLVGCYRDFSLLACAILRHQGRPARLRHGSIRGWRWREVFCLGRRRPFHPGVDEYDSANETSTTRINNRPGH